MTNKTARRNRKNNKPSRRQKRKTPRMRNPLANLGRYTLIQGVNRPPKMDNSFYERVCGVYNPFCPEAMGAKIYDVSSARTLTMQLKTLVPITTNADGYALYQFTPCPIYMGAKATLNTSGVSTAFTGLGAFPAYSSVAAACHSFRVVSFGVKIVPIGPVYQTTGAAIITETDSTISVGASVDNLNQSPVTYVRSMVGDNTYFISRPIDLEYTDFKPMSSTESINQRTSVVVGITGAQSGFTYLMAELVLNIELTPLANSVGAFFPTQAAPAIPAIMNVAADVARNISPITTVGSDTQLSTVVMNEVKQVGYHALAMGGSALRNAITAALLTP